MNLEDFVYKKDSPELKAYFQQFGKDMYISADEINIIVNEIKDFKKTESSERGIIAYNKITEAEDYNYAQRALENLNF